jgi:nucleotide-binding universal stress UspA family protein
MLTSSGWHLDWEALGRHGLRRNKIFQSILFPVDFSDSCKGTASYVRDLAKLTGGTITLLHVIPCRPAWYGAADVHSEVDGNEALRGPKRAQLAALAGFRDEYFTGVPCEIRVEAGAVGEQIVDYAAHSGADLIMMPTRGTASTNRSLIGPNAATVLRSASCAVWTGPHSEKLKPFTGFPSIVCAIAPDAILAEYVNEATALGAIFGSSVTFASAITSVSGSNEGGRVLTLEEEYPEAGLDQLFAGSRSTVYVETGPVGYVVRHVAEIQSADLVVINRRRTPQSLAGFETHAYEIILESPCPVLSLPMRAMALSIHIAQEHETYMYEHCTYAEA